MDKAEKGQRLMSLRVSHDSGQTWSAEVVVISSDPLAPLLTSTWPPCQCLRCVPGSGPASVRPTGGTAQ
ncbi:hypothetical protein EF902_38890 [Streptomyces sp. WAC05858]|nr:hypothetical protein EF902_38890 [Streptomyces sp. WAC05858]